MKRIVLILSFLFILTIGYTQNLDYKKNEVSIGLINLVKSPENQEIFFENSYYSTPFSNLTYKRFINEKNAIRLSYYRPINKSYDKSGGDWIDKGEYKEQTLKIGYEYVFKNKKFTPYFAVDIIYLKSTSSRTVGGGFTGEMRKVESNKNGFGLTPAIGLDYNLFKNIFIGLESNLSILYLNNEKISSQSLPQTNILPLKENDQSFEYLFNPIAFLVKVKF